MFLNGLVCLELLRSKARALGDILNHLQLTSLELPIWMLCISCANLQHSCFDFFAVEDDLRVRPAQGFKVGSFRDLRFRSLRFWETLDAWGGARAQLHQGRGDTGPLYLLTPSLSLSLSLSVPLSLSLSLCLSQARPWILRARNRSSLALQTEVAGVSETGTFKVEN